MQKIDSTILFGSSVDILSVWFQTHQYSSIHVLCDNNTYRDCWPKLAKVDWPSQPYVFVIQSGEPEKNLSTCAEVWDDLVADSADRNSLLINLGGGVLTDLGGFCAASFMRGMKFLHVPTTILAMTDASIGGKHGVDFRSYKNYIGTFAEPECTLIDASFIDSLDPREVRSGLAEVVKHGLLADKGLVDILLEASDLATINWNPVIRRSIQVKLGFVHDDIFDHGMRAALNFGHTIGHAIETNQLSIGTPLRHGEAVAMGMLVEAAISVSQLGLSQTDFSFIEDIIKQLFHDLRFPEISSSGLQKLLFKDKKKSGQDVLFSLLKAIGEPVVGQQVPTSIVNEAYLHYNS